MQKRERELKQNRTIKRQKERKYKEWQRDIKKTETDKECEREREHIKTKSERDRTSADRYWKRERGQEQREKERENISRERKRDWLRKRKRDWLRKRKRDDISREREREKDIDGGHVRNPLWRRFTSVGLFEKESWTRRVASLQITPPTNLPT